MIWEDVVKNNFDALQTYLLKLVNKYKYLDRYILPYVTKASVEQSYDFYTKYHIDGFVKSSNHISVWYGTECVAMLSYTEYKNHITINRFCSNTKEDCFKVLLNHLPQYKKIIVDCDKSLEDESFYKQYGFKKEIDIKPEYQYTYCGNRYLRYNFTKNKLKDKFPEIYHPEKTEREMMQEAGYKRIYDCGKIRYVLEV